MLTQHIALVPETYGMNASELARVSAALQKQVTRDLAPLWGVTATVDAFPQMEDVPIGCWPIVLSFKRLSDRAGVHLDRNGAPYAQIEVTPMWPLHASRACLEMLINPYGMRTVSVRPPGSDKAPIDLLVEICAPCQDARYGYRVNDILVSDFCTPAFFGEATAFARYSLTESVTAPFQVLPGGHITWREALSDRWWRKSYHDDCEAEAELDAARPRFGAPRAIEGGDTTLEIPADVRYASVIALNNARLHSSMLASQAAARRLRAQLDSPSSTPYGSQHFEMLVEMLNSEDAPTAAAPAPSPTQTATPVAALAAPTASVPPPLPQSTTAATAPTMMAPSSPTLAPFSIPSAGTRPSARVTDHPVSWRGPAYAAAGAVAAICLVMIAPTMRRLTLDAPHTTQTPVHASAPPPSALPVVVPQPVLIAPPTATPTVAAEPIVVAAPAVVPVAAPSAAPRLTAAEAEARRARRRAKRDAARGDNPALSAVTTRPTAADPLDSLLDTRL